MIKSVKILILKFSEIGEVKVNDFFEDVFDYLSRNLDMQYIILDFKNISYIGSSMVSGFLKIFNKYSQSRRIYCCNINRNVLNVLEMLKIDKIMNIKKTLNEVVEEIEEEGY